MAHSFSIDITGKDLKQLLSNLKQQVTSNGGLFEGCETTGNFSGGGVSGIYAVSGCTLVITITKKPFIAPMSLVESKIRSYFAGK